MFSPESFLVGLFNGLVFIILEGFNNGAITMKYGPGPLICSAL